MGRRDLRGILLKPVATVQLGVARLGIICSDIPDDSKLGAWLRRFHRALALSDLSVDEYASELLGDVEQYRESERNRKHLPPDSEGKTRNTKERRGFRTQTDSKTDKKSVRKTERKTSFTDSKVFEFEKFKEHLPGWSDAKCRHWWNQADGYSRSKGATYLDWMAAVQNWDRKEPFKEKTEKAYNPMNP